MFDALFLARAQNTFVVFEAEISLRATDYILRGEPGEALFKLSSANHRLFIKSSIIAYRAQFLAG